jgi:pentose-5-phosphate-3-epimerase
MLKLSAMISWIRVSDDCKRTDAAAINYCLVTTKVAPWIQRASDIKAEVVVNHELEHKLQQHNEEIIKLIKDVRLKVLVVIPQAHDSNIASLFVCRTNRCKNPKSRSVYWKREWK